MGHGHLARWLTAISLLALITAIPSIARGQSALSGIVHDPTSCVAVGATVIVDDNVGGRWEGVSNGIGYYEIHLPPGEYNVEAYLDLDSGQQLSYIGGVLVLPNENKGLDITLEYRNVERVTVASTSSPGALLPAESALGETFTRAVIETLPLSNGRTLQSLLALVPGIVVTDSVGTLAQFTAAGQRRYANRLTVDGINADLAVDVLGRGVTTAGSGVLPAFSTTGSTQTLIPLDAIEEIAVRTTNAPAAQAQTPGAQTIIVTRAGMRHFTGDVFADSRPTRLQAADWFTSANGDPRRPIGFSNLGASVGGPLAPRLFSFVTWEHEAIDRPLEVHAQVPALSLRDTAPPIARAILDAFPVPTGPEQANGLAEFSTSVPARSRLSALNMRLDAPLTTKHHLFGRFNRGTSEGDALSDLRQQPTVSFTGTEATATTTTTVGLTSVSHAFVHDVRANLTIHRGTLIDGAARYAAAPSLPLDALAATPDDAWVRVNVYPGGFIINGLSGASSERQTQIVDTWTFPHGAHDWQAGIDVRQVTTATHAPSTRYTYAWSNLAAVIQGPPRFITIDAVQPARARLRTWAVFAQDTWRLSPRTTLSYGLRAGGHPAPASLTGLSPLVFDEAALPQLQPHSDGAPLWRSRPVNLAPRAGLIHQLDTNDGHETQLRAGWSLVYDDATPPGAAAFGSGYPYLTSRVIRPSVFPVPAALLAQATALGPFTETTIADAYAFPSELRAPWTQEWHVGLDRALGRAQRASVAYVGAAGRDLTYPYTVYVDANHAIHAFSNDGTSDYHALLAEFVRHAPRVDARVAYTWSHAIDLDSGESTDANLPPALAPPRANRGSADFDRRHVLRALVSYRVSPPRSPRWARPALSDWQFDVVGMVISGAPVTVTIPGDLANGTYTLRADPVAGMPVWIGAPQSPTRRAISPDAFQPPAADRQGTLGRNTLNGSALRQVDVALSRSIRLGPRVAVECRIDAFNVLNVTNVGSPNAKLDRSPFGQPLQTYAEALGTGTLSYGGLVPAQQIGGPRSIQLGVRVRW